MQFQQKMQPESYQEVYHARMYQAGLHEAQNDNQETKENMNPHTIASPRSVRSRDQSQNFTQSARKDDLNFTTPKLTQLEK